MNRTTALLVLGAACCIALAPYALTQQSQARFPSGLPGLADGQSGPPTANWLLDADTDEERFRRIQMFAGGTYQQMWQIGDRFEKTHQAIVDDNLELAAYHWFNLRRVFNIALLKRPGRTELAESMFLDTAWGELDEALDSGDRDAVRASFLTQREACIACHVAEDMAFLNDSPIFRDTASFPSR